VTPLRPEPLSFGPAERPLFGWLHHAAAGAPKRSMGVVICKPFGYEAICAHRSLRHFAAAAAELGVAALSFDYDGTGDSAGSDQDPARWKAWVASVHHAVDELKRRTAVERVALLGTRLGASLASAAAIDRDDVVGFVAIVPVVRGSAWLRELNALELAMRFAGPPPGLEANGNEESVGFVITPETKASLRGVDLTSATRPPASDVLILDRNDLPLNGAWAERLAALGARVDHRRLPGYAHMMRDPHDAIVPTEMVAAFSDWVDGHAEKTTAHASPVTRTHATVGPIPVAPGVEETSGYLEEGHNVFGVVSAPRGKVRGDRAIVLLNSGAISHIGPSRLYVELARRWAAQGYLVLRFDQPGLGDSLPYPGESENVVYSRSALRGVSDALTFLRTRWHVTDIEALGLCSGAYHAFKSAVAGLPLQGVALVNPLVFFWKPGMSLAYPPHQVSEATARYKRSVFQLQKWKKLFSGNVSLKVFAQIVARRALMRGNTLVRDLARAVGRPLPEDLGAELEAVAARGVALAFIFATGDPGEDLLKSQGGRAVGRLLRHRRLRIHRIAGPNHSFTPVWTHIALTKVLEEELGLR
jgi:alpha-beta hydrolase superfamily lysophospholipase